MCRTCICTQIKQIYVQSPGNSNLNINLPYPPDANIDEYDYRVGPDNYAHAHGAKLWLVTSSAYSETDKKVTTWSPSDFLLETDLISYTDTNIN